MTRTARPLLAARDGEDHRIGRGAHETRLDAAEDRAGVDQHDFEVLLGFLDEPAQRLRQ